MTRRSTRGKGSNQYADKLQTSPIDTENQNQRVRQMKNFTGVQLSGPLGHSLQRNSTQALTTGLSRSLDNQFSALLSGKPTGTPEMRERMESISAFEDGIMTKHNDAYGQAVVEGAYFLVEAKHSPNTKAASQREGTPEHALYEGYSRLLSDAKEESDEEITLEELPQLLDKLNGAAIARNEGTSWQEEQRGEPTLSSRFAATSVFSSRDPQNSSLQQQLQDLRNQLHQRGISKIDI